MKKFITVVLVILAAGFILAWIGLKPFIIKGHALDLGSLVADDLGIDLPANLNYTYVKHGDQSMLFVSFKKENWELLDSLRSWQIITLSEPPRARPYDELAPFQIAYFTDPLSPNDFSVVGVVARKERVLIQVFYSEMTGVCWMLFRGIEIKNFQKT
jgi:hypothetical protein